MKRIILSATVLTIALSSCNKQETTNNTDTSIQNRQDIKSKIDSITNTSKATFGISVYDIKNKKEIYTQNRDTVFAPQSVFKLPVALSVLHLVDEKKLNLNKKILLTPANLLEDTYSPMRDKYAGKENVEVSIQELLGYMVSKSDNNACDILIQEVGGAKAIDDYIRSLGVDNISVAVTEQEMKQDNERQYENKMTPKSATTLLEKLYDKEILKEETHNLLWTMMGEEAKSKLKIQGKLPEEVLVIHKTGMGFDIGGNRVSSSNDIGIVTMPNDKDFIISIFIKNASTEDEALSSDIAKVAYDYFNK